MGKQLHKTSSVKFFKFELGINFSPIPEILQFSNERTAILFFRDSVSFYSPPLYILLWPQIFQFVLKTTDFNSGKSFWNIDFTPAADRLLNSVSIFKYADIDIVC